LSKQKVLNMPHAWSQAAIALSLTCGIVLPAQADPAQLLGSISASTIVAISDGDFVGQTYATGRLAPSEAGYRDLLTVVSTAGGRITTASVPVSSSVTSAPEILALSRDARTAFVVERLGERPTGAEMVRDLPPGNRLFAVDLADKANPRLADTVEIEAFPEALALDPDGKRVAVVSNTPEASFVQLVDYTNGRFGAVSRFNLADLGVRGTALGPRGGVTATNVQWHPSGRFLAINVNTQNRVAFFEVLEGAIGPSLRPWGNVVEVGPDPFVGRFTPDGDFYLTSDWGRNFAATDLAGRIPDQPSSISVIRLGAPTSGVAARHDRIARVATDVAAEGIAVSPDGSLVATINMRSTAFPATHNRFERDASVTLLTFDSSTGTLTKIGDFPFEGVLPEGGTFDPTGDHFLATVFHGHEDSKENLGAGLEVFRVGKGDRPALERLGRIPMPHGVHHIETAR
jgi:hypothetical protein